LELTKKHKKQIIKKSDRFMEVVLFLNPGKIQS